MAYYLKSHYNYQMSNKTVNRLNIAVNKKARHDFMIEETLEAGLLLQGWEVKSLRAGRAQITDSYVLLKDSEAWMIGSLITPLPTVATHTHPEPDRTRKLLLHRSEINKLIGYTKRKGYTVVVLACYWKEHRVKVELGLAKGKQLHDKRAAEKERDWLRQQHLIKRLKVG